MSKSSVVPARIEPEIKSRAEGLFRNLGLSPTEAIRLFYHQVCLRKGLPFAVEVPNDLTEKTLLKSKKGEEVTVFDSLDGMFASWDK